MLEDKTVFEIIITESATSITYPKLLGKESIKVSTQDLATRFYNSTRKDSGVLPPVIRYISPDFRSFIVERPPTNVAISVYNKNKKNPKKYTIPLPWTLYVQMYTDSGKGKLNTMYIFFKNSQIFSEADPVCLTPLPNLYPDGQVCWGDTPKNTLSMLAPGNLNLGSITQKINSAIFDFWNSEFNIDLLSWMDAIPEALKPKSFKKNDIWTSGNLNDWLDELLTKWSKLSLYEATELEWKTDFNGTSPLLGNRNGPNKELKPLQVSHLMEGLELAASKTSPLAYDAVPDIFLALAQGNTILKTD